MVCLIGSLLSGYSLSMSPALFQMAFLALIVTCPQKHISLCITFIFECAAGNLICWVFFLNPILYHCIFSVRCSSD